ncbi:protein-L-isoaspartate(D-aspartate) O-methyltransferase [Tautonia sp. JC769]|uniref:protein-L-isoaspartate(D-aspartate) O-methyltransferase n=1 Tax=Tautonia sp. JC769 TaxID=3232135 RepID=UPI00345A2128
MNAPGLERSLLSCVKMLGWLISLGPVLACVPGDPGRGPSGQEPPAGGGDDPYARRRGSMVDRQLHARDIDDDRVLEVMARVPRHEFVPEDLRDLAYADRPLPIEKDQTISQPYIVALMTQLARPQPGDRALDVGTGSGYQAAVLSGLVEEVCSIEIHRELADSARERLARLGYRNVRVRHGDGYRGWPEAAPFDLIIVAAAPPAIPEPLIDQLAPGGRLVLPVGDGPGQNLVLIDKGVDGSIHRETIAPVSFVPMTGEAQDPRSP